MDEGQPSDEVLVQRAKRGEGDAFDQLVARHYRRIYALAFQLLGNADDAADATQETFVKAFEQLRTFRGRAAFATWLYRIAVNTCRDRLRQPRPLPFSQLANDDHAEFDPALLTEPNPEEELAQRERKELVWLALKQLPEEARQILVLCDMQGFSYAEVAAILGVPEGTVKSRLHRARHAFKEAWLHLEGASPDTPQERRFGASGDAPSKLEREQIHFSQRPKRGEKP